MSSSITCTRLSVFALAALIIQIIGLSLFVSGFFPVKPALSGVSGPESFSAPCSSDENQSARVLPPDQLRLLYEELSGIPPSFDRLILMVIDGLPAEFVLGKDGHPPSKALMEAMPYTQSLLANGMAIGYHAKAAPPTVTMPRLKAMVSGAVGGFLDVAFNFNTQALLDDNLIDQFSSIAWKMVMLGDETWLKLFPGVFERHDGVSSFYVKDTIQVDQNVSRHLENELSRNDWSLMILHYLGLDHVGHIGGRNSVLMVPKLMEMDEVVKRIHLNSIRNENGRPTLLVVVSDHGMTESGNHGGSSYEETDSLAVFIGLRNHISDYASATQNTAHQVDIAPTLSLLFGVPIPKNNIGVLISETLDFLTADQKLRALEINSWQLLRLLQAQLPGLSCGNFLCGGLGEDHQLNTTKCYGSMEKMFLSLYFNAKVLHSSWKSRKVSGFSSKEDYSSTAAAYYKFLNTASEWLSHQVADKPINQLAAGVAAMLLSCAILLSLILCMCRDIHLEENKTLVVCLDETFVLSVILILIISMGSSSMVEEEQYIWHFVTSTLYLLLLRKTLQSLQAGRVMNSSSSLKVPKGKGFLICSIFVLLVSGRILRGWHQGGVNWTYLPDISKWLEQAGSHHLKSLQLVSGLLVMGFSLFSLFMFRLKARIVLLVGFSFLMSGSLILCHIVKYQESVFASSMYGAILFAQAIYAVLGISTIGTVVSLPWFMPAWISQTGSNQNRQLAMELKDSLYVIGWAYIVCWCLLQLLLQQPANSIPVLLLLIQILSFMLYSFYSGPNHKQLIEVAALYYLGMAGHFALGNSNTLATIDVAGAFIGLSSHSTFLSGVLMFIITYASPMLVLLSMVMHISIKGTTDSVSTKGSDSGHLLKMMLGFPCLVPLCLNSILLTAYTILLLLMRNHLFVWSVFSPKYLYVCATTVCVYIGVFVVAATVLYTYLVLSLRRRRVKVCG